MLMSLNIHLQRKFQLYNKIQLIPIQLIFHTKKNLLSLDNALHYIDYAFRSILFLENKII